VCVFIEQGDASAGNLSLSRALGADTRMHEGTSVQAHMAGIHTDYYITYVGLKIIAKVRGH